MDASQQILDLPYRVVILFGWLYDRPDQHFCITLVRNFVSDPPRTIFLDDRINGERLFKICKISFDPIWMHL
jgi:hypothetical protein